MSWGDDWSDGENGRFEDALNTYGEETPGRWELVAAAVGGGRTADDVIRHNERLNRDIQEIEAEQVRQQQHAGAAQHQHQHANLQQHQQQHGGANNNNNRRNDRRSNGGRGTNNNNRRGNNRGNRSQA